MSVKEVNHVSIKGIVTIVPEQVKNVDDELEVYNNDEKLLSRNKKILGMGTRHVIDDRTTNTDLCFAAALNLIEKLQEDKNSIDALIVVSSSHDYHYPASACVIQGMLDLPEECTCFDISGLSCSAYVHGLINAHALISSGCAKKVLLLAGDTNSTHTDANNRSHLLFGDAASATLLEYTEEENTAWFYTSARGKDYDKLIAPAGGSALPVREDISSLFETDSQGNVWHLWEDCLRGLDVFNFSSEVCPKGINALLEYSKYSIEDIDYVALHQVNKPAVNIIGMYAKLPKDKYSFDAFSKYGNCGSAAVVTEICSHLYERKHDKVMMATFGVGLSCGCCLVDLSKTLIFPVTVYKTPDGKMNRQEKIAYWTEYYKAGNRG